MTKRDTSREQTIKANIYVHAFLANSGEYQKSPHLRLENQEKVRGILKRLIGRMGSVGNAKLIDFGCGTGFIIALAKDVFAEIYGVDITLDMMKQVDLSSGNVFLHGCLAEKTPFVDGYFDFATAYSFMDHLFDYKDFLKEAHRVLKPGGIFYSDLNPNRDFIVAMSRAETGSIVDVTAIVEKEIKGALHNGAHYSQSYGMDGILLDQAEPIKSIDKGFDATEVVAAARAIGFSQCEVEYEWFLGQAKLMHEQSIGSTEIVDSYLTSTLPISSQLYKYLRFIFIK